MSKLIRHGDLGLTQIDKLPAGMTKADTKILLKGSHGHDHSIDNGTVYFKQVDTHVFGYLVVKNTKLFHKEHSPKGELIEDGVYELRRQTEHTPTGLKPVID